MVDLAKLIRQQKEDKLLAISSNLGSQYDFDTLREINIDDRGNPISPDVAKFLDWAESLLNRIPINWEDYAIHPSKELKYLFEEIEYSLNQIINEKNNSLAMRITFFSSRINAVKVIMTDAVKIANEIIFLQMIGADRLNNANYFIDRISNIESDLNSTLDFAKTKSVKLEEMVAASEVATAKLAASGRARIFHIEGTMFRDASIRWLSLTICITCILIFLSFGFAFGWIYPLKASASNAQIVSYVFSRLLCLGTLGLALAFSARQYAANKHNAVQNFHRSNALRTYRALLAASRDEAVHDAILHHAALAIFSPADSGYLKQNGTVESAPFLQLFQGVNKDLGRMDAPTT